MRKTALLFGTVLTCLLISTAAALSQCRVLTFDDGPLPPWTTKVLDALKRENVKATFFVVGSMVRAYPDVLRRIAADGHEIGVHSNTHPKHFELLTEAQVRKEFTDADAVIRRVIGFVPRIVRIPGGADSPAIRAALKGRIIVGWGKHSDPDDWKFRNAGRTTRVVSAMPQNEIVLMHDIVPTTTAAVPAILANYKREGARFVTVSEFLSGTCTPVRSAKVKAH